MRGILKNSVEYKEKRLLEKEIGVLGKTHRDFYIHVDSGNSPVLGKAIRSLREITDESVSQLISLMSSRNELTSMDIDSFCWQAKFAVIEEAVQSGADCGQKLGALNLLDCERICREYNPLDGIFSEDPLYGRLTPETKALYRKMTSDISVTAGIDESRLSREYANTARKDGKHIGEIITGDYRRVFPYMKTGGYIAALIIPALILAGAIGFFTSLWFIPALIFPAFAIVKPIADFIISKSVRAAVPLPQIDLGGKIPVEAKTLCVISTLLTRGEDVRETVKRLDAARLKNNSDHLCFCALCDFAPAESAETASDNDIIEAARRCFAGKSGYVALIRKRAYSETQRVYQGEERKRGAIEALAELLRGGGFHSASFREIAGDRNALDSVKYICALDYDTIPLMDSVSELVGIALHPCNKNAGVIAPRITTTLESSLKTGFSRAVAGNGGCAGASTYDSFSGEFYQDCFGEGIFTGKGLIDVDVFLENCKERFPKERVLSHDILEGGFTGVLYAGDVEFSDSFPDTSKAYFKRQNRWLRGDLQNFRFIFNRDFSLLTRIKLADNLRRALSPLFLFGALFLMFLPFADNRLLIGISVSAAVIMPFLTGFLPSVVRGRNFANNRRFYSPVLSQTKQLLLQCVMELLLLPKNALVSLDALVRTVWRMLFSKKHLLDWTTSAAFSGRSGFSHMIMAELAALALFFAAGVNRSGFMLTLCALFLSALPVTVYCDRVSGSTKVKIPDGMRKELALNAEKIWRFYEDFVTAGQNWLPPDNVQYSPVYRITSRTSPTNVGMYLLSCAGAWIFGFINSGDLAERVGKTLDTVEKLDKWHGNLYNWYDNGTFEILSPFISSVDSGNFVCCLVALKEALKEAGCPPELVARAERLIGETDLTPFYNKTRDLFSIGYDSEKGELSFHNYDLLMSEARMLSYYAIATGQAEKRHWRALGRVIGKRGRYAAPVAWTGTMFEYFMPELLLSSKEGSMEYEALRFCLHCQQQRGKETGLPFGVSESGYYAFDRELNYQYKAHGVQDIGLKAGLNKERVISPYSSFLAMSYDPVGCYNNLARLEKMGLSHKRYGFYEAVDFTPHRVGSGHAAVKSHMSHHMGMSLLGITNALYDGKIQRLFLADEKMQRAEELMEEKIIAGEPVLGVPERQEERELRTNADVLTRFSLDDPRLNALSNGKLTVLTSDIGVSQTLFKGKSAFFPTADLYRPRGNLFAFVENNTVLPLYNHPSAPPPADSEQSVVFTQNTSEYYASARTLKAEMQVFLDENRAVEIRSFAVENKSSAERRLILAAYLEPALARKRDILAHPAFMDFFLKLSYDDAEKLFTASRKERDSGEETVMAVGFRDKEEFTFSFNREEIIERNSGIFSALNKARESVNSETGVPSPCLFIRTDFHLGAHGKKNAHLLIAYGGSAEEAKGLIREIRGGVKPEPSEEIISPLVSDTLYGRLTRRLLGKIVCAPDLNKAAVAKNTLDKKELWRFGISGDVPIVVFEFAGKSGSVIDSAVEMKKALSLCGVEYDLVILCEDEKQVILCEQLRAEIGTEAFIIRKADTDEKTLTLVRAAASLTMRSGDLPKLREKLSGKGAKGLYPALIPVRPCKKPKTDADKPVSRFSGSDYIIENEPVLPWSNVLANSRFGTLVSDKSLGFTWALNSRENKLTPWLNDLRGDNKGEMLVIRSGGRLYDIVDGSRAVFSPNAARYEGLLGNVETRVSVRVFEKGMGKRVNVEFFNNGAKVKTFYLAYYLEPVMGVDREGAALIKPSVNGSSLIFVNPSNGCFSGATALSTDRKAAFLTDKRLFKTGDWFAETASIAPSYDLIGAVIVKIELPPKHKDKIRFILSFTQNTDAPLSMAKALKHCKTAASLPVKEIDTGSADLDALYKHWLPWQVIGCRMWARTGFYQNSGAYGFRDQLQDCLAAALIQPSVAKQQIIRCCCAQFPEGDVLHWWHDLPKTKKGVRTRYSDDLLWLPYVTAEYVKTTGDKSILGIGAHYCAGQPLGENEHERYFEVACSALKENVYLHAKRALDKAHGKGRRGLLLMGGGDWCDGYNNVGLGGKGESVWLTMFYVLTARVFSETSRLAGDSEYAVELEKRASELITAIDKSAWDGEHYLRAYYDNGDKMGSRERSQCGIDLLPQAFAAIAGLPDKARAEKAVKSALANLYDANAGIIKLFAPPFERGKTRQNPGYVMSYPPGVRENGGQYTHAAIWLVFACLKLGMTEKAGELLAAIAPFGRGAAYKTEPYYLAADIYANPAAYGRGGWSLYTGSAGWYYAALRELNG